MAISRLLSGFLPGALLRYAERLRFPQLFLVMLVLFLLDLVIPDVIPFIDEILLGLATLLLASWRRGGGAPEK
ncbi:hypothetical protein GCM10025771_33060 [Niveibacterium umoris]|uniref:Uncharacterized protein n=1 Tax=Niveibacterium umoris TaxID=1193620 RepID=A0A840BDA3_9RHOO|nr:DUF6116 family protein [Niveibacterium umoris]MBB4011501.1 hypothetical protein [Niveibacterium umoris]